jgi:hypothetical protein
LVATFALIVFIEINEARQSAEDARSRGRLLRIAVALRDYHTAHGEYPPLYSIDDKGNKLHSWRVLLLPYLDCGDYLRECRLAEPWDSEHNLNWARSLPRNVIENFVAWDEPEFSSGSTAIVAIDNSNERGTNQRLELSNDGCEADTICLTELFESKIYWTEPRDLALRDARKGLLRAGRKSVRVVTRGGLVATLSSTELVFRGSESDLLENWLRSPTARSINSR